MAEPNDPEGGEDPWADALAEQAEVEGGGGDDPGSELLGDVGSDPLGFGELDDDGEEGEPVDLEMILDIPVTISMEIGRTQISIRNLLKLNQGSVVELDRLAGEPLDVLVNGTLIAHGEVVVVNEKFGIRLTDVITAMERIQKLT
jgi:flagellar motor switch protein FliN/FliY